MTQMVTTNMGKFNANDLDMIKNRCNPPLIGSFLKLRFS